MRSSGRSATAGSRLFISIRSAASWCHPLQDSAGPVGAEMLEAGAEVFMGENLTHLTRSRQEAASGTRLRPSNRRQSVRAGTGVDEVTRDLTSPRRAGHVEPSYLSDLRPGDVPA